MNRKYYRGIWISKNIDGKWYWGDKPYPTEYLCKKAIDLAIIHLKNSIHA